MTKDIYDGYTHEEIKELKRLEKEAESEYGESDAWKESQKNLSRMKKGDIKRITNEANEIYKKIFNLKSNHRHDSPKVQKMIELHYENIKNYFTPTASIYIGIGEGYVKDPRFTKNIEKHGEGLAVFMRDAIKYYTKKKLN